MYRWYPLSSTYISHFSNLISIVSTGAGSLQADLHSTNVFFQTSTIFKQQDNSPTHTHTHTNHVNPFSWNLWSLSAIWPLSRDADAEVKWNQCVLFLLSVTSCLGAVCSKIFQVVVLDIFYFHPEPWGNDPISQAYFSIGLVKNHQLVLCLASFVGMNVSPWLQRTLNSSYL